MKRGQEIAVWMVFRSELDTGDSLSKKHNPKAVT